MKQCVLIVIGLLLLPWTARAESVSCSGRVVHVTVESGPLDPKSERLFYPRTIEEGVWEGRDEEHPTLIEWNVNDDEKDEAAVAHCYHDKEGKTVEHVVVPKEIKRCRWASYKFSCQSGTVTCPGGVGRVLVERQDKSAPSTLMPDVVETGRKGPLQRWFLSEERMSSGPLVAHCFDAVTEGQYGEIIIPTSMKECAFANRRFICTDDPNKHDAFWPEYARHETLNPVFHTAQTAQEKRLETILKFAVAKPELMPSLLGRSTLSAEAKRAAESFFTPKVVALWQEKEKKSIQENCDGVAKEGELCGLDYDPLFCAQDHNDGHFLYRTEPSNGDEIRISVKWGAQADRPVLAVYQLVHVGAVWKLDGVHCGVDD